MDILSNVNLKKKGGGGHVYLQYAHTQKL